MAGTGRGRSVEKARLWTQRVRGHGRSGLSVRAFCEEEGINESSFYYWRRELALRQAEADATHNDHADREARDNDSQATAATFLPVTIATSPPSSAAIELAWPDGLVMRVAGGCVGEDLRTVLAALERAPC